MSLSVPAPATGRVGVEHVPMLGVMQRMYERWSVNYAWMSEASLSRRPRAVDPSLFSSVILGRAVRSTAVGVAAGGRLLAP